LRRLPVDGRCGIGAQHALAVIHGHPLLIAAYAYLMRAIGLNGTLKPALQPHRWRLGHAGQSVACTARPLRTRVTPWPTLQDALHRIRPANAATAGGKPSPVPYFLYFSRGIQDEIC